MTMKLRDEIETPALDDLELQPVEEHTGASNAPDSHFNGGFSLLSDGGKLSSTEKNIRVARKRSNFQDFTCG